ncbi:putative non-specific serine/threonine protein kinase [Helianthus annuus]|nr:putative non-specific serine/threonine protein kinase [Helianthus annuus]
MYAFGVVLFELLSGRLAVDELYGEEECSSVRWAKKCGKERKIDQMVDPHIKGTIHPKCARGFTQIANRCVHSVLKERPTMTEVVASLQELRVLEKKYDYSVRSRGKT